MEKPKAPATPPIVNAVVVMENTGSFRKCGGNNGYEDSPGENYAFDSAVHLANEIKIGTLLILSRNRVIEEVGRVHTIRAMRGVKETLHCPNCQRQSLERRSSGDFYCTRCKNRAKRADVIVLLKPVTKYIATYGGTTIPVRKRPDSSSILPFMETRDTQSAIRRVETTALKELGVFLDIDLHNLHFPDEVQD